MEALYCIKTYFGGKSAYIALTQASCIRILYSTYLQFRCLKWPFMKSLRHTETQTNSTKWAKFRTFKTPLASTSLLPCPVSKSQAQYWRAIYVGHNGCSNPPTVISWSGRDRNGGKLINMKVGCSIFLLFAKRTGAGHLLLQPTNSH